MDRELTQFFGPVSGFGANQAEDVALYRLAPPPK